MANTGLPAAPSRALARLLDARGSGSGRRIATIACIAALAGVALIGTLHPFPVAGGVVPAASASGAAPAGSVFGGGDITSGVNWPDLLIKGTIVLALLFITLRVLGRTGAGAPKRGGKLEVLESRPLAPKASLHLVAIGDRRLVVGLTPSGMVSLAELDAAELETETAANPAADAVAAAGDPAAMPSFDLAGLLGPRPQGSPQPTIGSAVDWAMRPIDAVTGRLTTFLNGGRVR
jgi:flagellar biosynthetic protein FliO